MLLSCGVGEDSWESLGLQGDQTNQSSRKSVLNIHWKDWSWSSNTLATWCKELAHWKRPWSWERLKAGGGGDDRGGDGWMASLTWWTWVWVISGSWWWEAWHVAVHGVIKSWTRLSELNWTEPLIRYIICKYFPPFYRLAFYALSFAQSFQFCFYFFDITPRSFLSNSVS